MDMRQARYQGIAKVHIHHVMTALALNLIRLDNWLAGVPLARTRRSPFARLCAA